MPNALETPWVTLEVNDVPLSLCNDLGRPNLGMISWSSFFTTSSAFSVQVGKSLIHPVNVSIMTSKHLYLRNWHLGEVHLPVLSWVGSMLLDVLGELGSSSSLGVV